MNRIKSISGIVVFCIAISLFWCVDSDCLIETIADQCIASHCGSMGDHQNTSAHSHDSNDHNCSCLCHVPSVEYGMAVFSYHPPVNIIVVSFSCHITSTPGRTVFRPPTAA